jgi:hypothetical protein
MTFKLAVVVVIGMSSAGMCRTVSAQEKSQWDSVYTQEQAARGRAMYYEHCLRCHEADLRGSVGPCLVCDEFSAKWNGLTLGQLFDEIRQTQPRDQPGLLSREMTADILSFMLLTLGAPAGPTELPTQSEVLGTIKYIATNPTSN